ncbi:phage gp6-like head-tail connector protein [Clostridium gasigenes]|uniref:head-tail connector protein n=1 Tax=Clostridium gasigenes TaxID=94869 RepID=UPI0014386967|nr:head-tail connector protein [Clostridium gasigenes]NKF05299.1 phage gp6-like head-tail connector protein [Clostridium gasigenes]QSW18753.1 phage gp6-like head-tail connector protein [Clostridium gasigenes]
MKISEVTIDIMHQFLRIDSTEDDILLQIIKDAAKAYIKAYTGLTDEEIEKKDDLTMAYMVSITEMYENRSITVEKDKVNKIIDSILNMHSINLL